MNCCHIGWLRPYCWRRRSICSGVAASPAIATAGSDGTAWISRKVTTNSPSKEGSTSTSRLRTKRSMSGREGDPAYLGALAHGAEAAALDPFVQALQLHGVVDPDIGAVGHDQADGLLVEGSALLLLDRGAGLAQQRVDRGVLVIGRGLPGAVELAVIHLADPVLRIDEIGADPVHPHVRRGFRLGRGGGQVRPDVADHFQVDADL